MAAIASAAVTPHAPIVRSAPRVTQRVAVGASAALAAGAALTLVRTPLRTEAAGQLLPRERQVVYSTLNGKVGIWGTCSGGRHAYLGACRVPGFDACVDCWGGRVVMAPEDLSPRQPVARLAASTSRTVSRSKHPATARAWSR